MNRHVIWDNFYALQRFGMTPNLDNIQSFCERLGHPECAFPSIHITGTNGKGSVAAMLDSIMRASGIRAGMYTSPHLLRFEERIRTNGNLIPESVVFDFLNRHWQFICQKRCTFFEVATAMAMDHFRNSGVELAVVEVGLGGTFDATQVVRSVLSIVTRIDLDHVERLGSTQEEIANDKAGIFRHGIPALSGAQRPDVLDALQFAARQVGAPFRVASKVITLSQRRITQNHISALALVKGSESAADLGRITCPLTGSFQFENLRTALAAAAMLQPQFPKIAPEAVREGSARVSWPGRLQMLHRRPHFILDVAHNPAAVLASLQNVQKVWKPRRIIAIFSALRDKDVAGMIVHLKRFATLGFVVPLSPPRGLGLEEIRSISSRLGWNASAVESVSVGVEESFSRAEQGDLILAIGSHYLAEEVLKNPKFR